MCIPQIGSELVPLINNNEQIPWAVRRDVMQRYCAINISNCGSKAEALELSLMWGGLDVLS